MADIGESETGERLQIRVHKVAAGPVLIYLPGLHGDWTLIGGFRAAVRGKATFVEFIYPRTLTWSLDQYAEAIENALRSEGIESGWLLGESFGSQLVWAIVARRRFNATGVVLAGGFVRHPAMWLVRLGGLVGARLPLKWITRILFGYAKFARRRFRGEPEVLAGIHEFIARRTELDKLAATHRLYLIAANDPRKIVCECPVPLYAVTGLLDPVVPWFFVRRWLKRNCAALRDYVIIPRSDHNVLSTASREAARHILGWTSVP